MVDRVNPAVSRENISMGCGASVTADDDKPKKRFKGGPAPESFMVKSAMNIAAAAAPVNEYTPSHNGVVNEVNNTHIPRLLDPSHAIMTRHHTSRTIQAVVKKDLKASRSKMLALRNAKIAIIERDTRMATGTHV